MLSVIGRGSYSVPLAARLLRLESGHVAVNPPAVTRWAFGYKRRGVRYQAAVDAGAGGKVRTLTFLELVELLHVVSFLKAGVSWPKVRDAIATARRLLIQEGQGETKHPLAQYEWFAEGGRLYNKLAREHKSKEIMEATGAAQVILDECLRLYLRQIVFDERTRTALQWFPVVGVGGPVVCDPLRSIGLPITAEGGVRTSIIAGQHRAGDSVNVISAFYRIPEYEVEAAIGFEDKLYARAA